MMENGVDTGVYKANQADMAGFFLTSRFVM
jgi:hypothetical protein